MLEEGPLWRKVCPEPVDPGSVFLAWIPLLSLSPQALVSSPVCPTLFSLLCVLGHLLNVLTWACTSDQLPLYALSEFWAKLLYCLKVYTLSYIVLTCKLS